MMILSRDLFGNFDLMINNAWHNYFSLGSKAFNSSYSISFYLILFKSYSILAIDYLFTLELCFDFTETLELLKLAW